ncbi:ATP-binding protein [uncultured Pseudoteredinibacter sp.]|uniref:sensor histidine kinase n=1 Tax=uncultured Pseudoteredinibacter sp. TaxID=1641701 RepID=UPI002615E68E|nr:ATP-binding protein [uncultured Pseudoteredinibacter sp.]
MNGGSLHNATKKFFSRGDRNSVAWRLLLYVLLVSSLFACVQTGIQIYLDYRSGINHIETQFQQIDSSYRSSLARSIWEVDRGQVKSIASGLNSLPGVEVVVVDEFIGEVDKTQCEGGEFSELARVAAGQSADFIERVFLIHKGGNANDSCIGRLMVRVSLSPLYIELTNKFLFILAFQMIKTLSVSIFILAIFHYLVARHLNKMVEFANAMDSNPGGERLRLDGVDKADDELTTLASALNKAKENMHNLVESRTAQSLLTHELQSRKEKEKLENQHREQMQKKNEALAEANEELLATVEQLGSTQEQLVRSERMASIGNMVRGVAHELNTPIGVAATGASLIQSKVVHLKSRYQAGSLTSNDLETGLGSTEDSADVVVNALGRAGKLIRSFKAVSVDDQDDQRTVFDIVDHIETVMGSQGRELSEHNIEFKIIGVDALEINSFPSAMYQVLTQLVRNSIAHAFTSETDNYIEFQIQQSGVDLLIHYRDNGRGLSSEEKQNIFDPFFTTSSDSERTGLGMNIVYNLIRDRFNGTINVISEPGKGVDFQLRFCEVLVDVANEV